MWKERLPGMTVCAVIAGVCYYLGMIVPLIGGPVFGIITGMLIGPWVMRETRLNKGVGFTSKIVLQTAVVLLGFGLNLNQIIKVGYLSLPIIISTIGISLVMAYVLCKLFNFPSNVATLVGVGSSICGGSAIAATAPVIGAKDEEVAQSISVIFIFNVMAALLFPTLGTWLGMSNGGFAIFAGTAVNDTSSVTAAAAIWDGMYPGAHALEGATIVKLTRTLAIIPITLCLSIYTSRQGGANSFSLRRALPMFIVYFVLAAIITTVGSFVGLPTDIFKPLQYLSKFFIIMAMTAIGLNTNLRKTILTGGPAILVGAVCWVSITLVSIGMQYVLGLL